MKLQIAFDLANLDRALEIAHQVEHKADILEVGTLLIYKYGELAIKKFKETFPQKTILADAKIADMPREAITMLASAGADWITVLAGTSKGIINTSCIIAHELGKKIMLDLIDASSLGQAALEARSLGADALLFHTYAKEDEQVTFADRWEIVKGNTQLPIFVASNITKDNISDFLSINASGIVVGKAITEAQNPEQEMQNFLNLIGRVNG